MQCLGRRRGRLQGGWLHLAALLFPIRRSVDTILGSMWGIISGFRMFDAVIVLRIRKQLVTYLRMAHAQALLYTLEHIANRQRPDHDIFTYNVPLAAP